MNDVTFHRYRLKSGLVPNYTLFSPDTLNVLALIFLDNNRQQECGFSTFWLNFVELIAVLMMCNRCFSFFIYFFTVNHCEIWLFATLNFASIACP